MNKRELVLEEVYALPWLNQETTIMCGHVILAYDSVLEEAVPLIPSYFKNDYNGDKRLSLLTNTLIGNHTVNTLTHLHKLEDRLQLQFVNVDSLVNDHLFITRFSKEPGYERAKISKAFASPFKSSLIAQIDPRPIYISETQVRRRFMNKWKKKLIAEYGFFEDEQDLYSPNHLCLTELGNCSCSSEILGWWLDKKESLTMNTILYIPNECLNAVLMAAELSVSIGIQSNVLIFSGFERNKEPEHIFYLSQS